MPPGEIERRVEARMIRQQILERDPPFELNLVLDESVLLRRIAPDKADAAPTGQAARDFRDKTVTLQILPLDAPHPIITGGFILLQFGKVHEVGYHDVAYLEHLTGAQNFEEEKETYQYQLAFERLADLSLSPGRSRDTIVRRRNKPGDRRLSRPARLLNRYPTTMTMFALIVALCLASAFRCVSSHNTAFPAMRLCGAVT